MMRACPEECRPTRNAEANKAKHADAVHEEASQGTPYAVIWRDGEELLLY